VHLVWLWTHTAVLTPNHYSGNYTGYQYAREFFFKMAVLTRKAHTTGTLTYLSQHLHQRTATYSTRSSSLPLLTVPNPSTVFARRHFNYTAPTTWNSLPADVLTCDSESGFKRLLKTHLFNNCFNVAWLTHSQRLCSSAYGTLLICLCAALAACPSTSRVQGCMPGTQVTGWSDTCIHSRRHPTSYGQWSPSATFSRCQDMPRLTDA